jgi:class 3 adenylate cyclase/predicted ATPase
MEIGAWLRSLGLERYEPAFRENEIDWEALPKLTAEDLKDLGVVLGGHRRRLLDAITALGSAKEPPAPALGPAATGEAERRQLTVMFCDLVGSTPLSQRFDPEDLREIVGTYHRCVADTVGRFAGFVAKYMGDGVLIYFGYPEAHEDDAERAVRAGLAVIDAVARLAISEPLNVRLGVASGLVVVGDLIGAGAAQERGVVGETPNLAARLQALARPGALVIAESTRRQIGVLFEIEDLGPQPLAGFAEPQSAWRVTGESGVLSRFEALRSEATPLVGRDEELDLLLRRWRQAKAGEGRVVLISGEPGIGKSRLSAALSQALQGEPHTRLRYFCSPHHQDSALHPFIAQLEHAAGFTRDDTAEEKLGKLKAMLAPAAPGDDETTLVAELLSLPNSTADLNLSPQRKRETLFEALLRQLEALARSQAVLMVFEDAHWVDPTSRELLDLTLDRASRMSVLVVVTFRPEFQHALGGQPHMTTLTLNRLGGHDGAVLVERLAGNAGLSPETVGEIVERADGVPLFVEELTKAVLESGDRDSRVVAVLAASPLPNLPIPATLHASLIARLDRLGPIAKEIGQVGAVIGREFGYELIEAVVRRPAAELRVGLDRLAESGLLFCRGRPPQSSYLFKHALVLDAAYGTLLRRPRQALHARIARSLEERFPTISETQPEVLARHFTQAGELNEAISYWLRGGRQAVAKASLVEGMEQLRRGLRLAADLPDTPERNRHILDCRVALAYALLAAKGYTHPEVLRAFNEAAELVSGVGAADPLDPFSVHYGLFGVYYVGGQSRAALAKAQEFLTLAELQSLSAPRQIGHRLLGTALMMNAEYRAALPHLEQAIGLYSWSEHGALAVRFGQDIGVAACARASWAFWHCGYPDQASKVADQAVRQAKQSGHAHTLNFALFWSSATTTLIRRPAEVETLAGEGIELADRHGFPLWATLGQIYQCWARAQRSEAPANVEPFRAGLTRVKAMGTRLLEPFYLGLQADVCAMVGQFAEGLAELDEAFAVSAETGQIGFDAELHRLRGDLLLRIPERGPSESENCFRKALATAQMQGARGYELRAATSLAQLWGEQGRRAEARELLAPVYGWFTEGFDTADLKEAKRLLDELA